MTGVTFPFRPTESPSVLYENSYWPLPVVHIDGRTASGFIAFQGWANKEEYEAGFPPIPYPSAIKRYMLSEESTAAFLTSQGVTLEQYMLPANLYAKSILDVDSGEVDEEGNPIMVSFFENAIEA